MDKKINWFQKGIFGRAWEIIAGERDGECGSKVDRATVEAKMNSNQMGDVSVGKVMEPHKMTVVGVDYALPHGEIRLSRKQWPKSASPVVVDIVYQGLVFTVAKATILVGKNEKKVLIEAEGISRLSPTDDPDNNNPIQGKEMAISQAIKALHTRVMRHRRSLHHYRG